MISRGGPHRSRPGAHVEKDIDRLYGLEPVIEPGDQAGSDAFEQFSEVTCPWCGEGILLRLDLSAGDHACIEDCQVCCRPIQVGARVGDDGALQSLSAERADP